MTKLRWNVMGLSEGTKITCGNDEGVIVHVDKGWRHDFSETGETIKNFIVAGITVTFKDGSTCGFEEDDVDELNLQYKNDDPFKTW